MKKSFTLLLAVCSCIISYAQIRPLRDINLTSISESSSGPDHLVEFNGQVFFAAGSSEGRELWKSDGTPEGTVLVKDINEGTNSSSPNHFLNVRGSQCAFCVFTTTYPLQLSGPSPEGA